MILTAAGEEAQVDYGTGPMVRDPQSGKYRRTRFFVLTLGYSRKSYACSSSVPVPKLGRNCARRPSPTWRVSTLACWTT